MGAEPRILLNYKGYVDTVALENLQIDTISLVEDLLAMTGTRKAAVFADECHGAQECNWDSISAPSRYKISKVDPEDLIDWVDNVGRLLIERAYPAMKKQCDMGEYSHLEKMYTKRQDDLISAQKALVEAQAELVKLQKQLLEKKEEAIVEVKTTAKEEMRSFSTVLKKECDVALAPQRIHKAVVAASEDKTCNIIVHGLEDSPGSSEGQLSELWSELEEKPVVKNIQRLGTFIEGRTRPLKISLSSRDMQLSVLGKKARLRACEKFSRVYISPDLTPEERKVRGDLVRKLKEMKEQNPAKIYRIQRGVVVEVPSAPGTQ